MYKHRFTATGALRKQISLSIHPETSEMYLYFFTIEHVSMIGISHPSLVSSRIWLILKVSLPRPRISWFGWKMSPIHAGIWIVGTQLVMLFRRWSLLEEVHPWGRVLRVHSLYPVCSFLLPGHVCGGSYSLSTVCSSQLLPHRPCRYGLPFWNSKSK